MLRQTFNKFVSLPSVPYKIIAYLAENNDRLFKVLYYNDIDALSKPNLTLEQKMDMIYVDEGKEVEKHLFLKPLVGEEMVDSQSQLRIYKYAISPIDAMSAVVNYRFDIITGSKISLVYDEDILCSRLDIIESEILNTLNGIDLFGTGYFQFNRDLSTQDKQILTLSNSKNFFGSILIMSIRWINLEGDNTCE
jgi:hypothetical protein